MASANSNDEEYQALTLEELYFKTWDEIVGKLFNQTNEPVISAEATFKNRIIVGFSFLRFNHDNKCFVQHDEDPQTCDIVLSRKLYSQRFIDIGNSERREYVVHFEDIGYPNGKCLRMLPVEDDSPLQPRNFTLATLSLWKERYEKEIRKIIISATAIFLPAEEVKCREVEIKKESKEIVKVEDIRSYLPLCIINFCILPFIFPTSSWVLKN